MSKKFIMIFFLVFTTSLFAQDSIPTYSFSFLGKVSQNDPTPFWLLHGRYGIIDPDFNEGIFIGDFKAPFKAGKNWNFETGAKLIGKTKIEDSYIQELFLNVQFGQLKLIAGKQEITFTQYSEDLSAGSYYLSDNARPIPRVGLGFYDYVDLPFTNGYLQVKGFINQGVLNDDRSPKGTSDPLFHEKIAYVRTNKLIINPHLGLNHSVLFGGTLPNGTKIPVDYWAVFFGGSSDKVGEVFPGEETNVAGAHLGLFDVGFNFDIRNIQIQTYFQKPISDGSGFWQFFERNQDRTIGVVGTVKNSRFVKEFVYEHMFTVWQSGPGAVDPKVNGQIVFSDQIDDYDQFIFDYFGIVVEGYDEEQFNRFLEREINYGNPFGGRDNYYNNGLYYKGWSYNGLTLGTPLILSEDRVLKFAPGFNGTWDKYFVNNRVKAHHFGLKGGLSKSLDYLIKVTYTRNYGSYFGLNKGANAWESADPLSTYEYYFQDKLSEYYFLVESTYRHPKINGLKFNFSFAADFGEMYSSVGILAGVSYSGNFKVLKPKTDE